MIKEIQRSDGNKMIYLLEDDDSIRKLVVYALNAQGMTAVGFEEPASFWSAMKETLPDLLLLDIMLPGEDGISILKRIRKNPLTSRLPVIMLTARSEEFDELLGYESGADDYVTKPFSPTILVKKVEALLRRTKSSAYLAGEKDLTFNHEAHEVRLNGQEIELTLKEYNILKKLLENPGRVYSREQLLDSIWGYDYVGDIRTVDSHIARLRTKLGDWGNRRLKTVYGIGYKLEEE